VRTLEHELPRRERVASAIALRVAGATVRAIAADLGVDVRTVDRYLAATSCSGCGGPAL
jgi:predicted transcriptional regulator